MPPFGSCERIGFEIAPVSEGEYLQRVEVGIRPEPLVALEIVNSQLDV